MRSIFVGQENSNFRGDTPEPFQSFGYTKLIIEASIDHADTAIVGVLCKEFIAQKALGFVARIWVERVLIAKIKTAKARSPSIAVIGPCPGARAASVKRMLLESKGACFMFTRDAVALKGHSKSYIFVY